MNRSCLGRALVLWALITVLAALLASCAPDPRRPVLPPAPDGLVAPPPGWLDYCRRYPEDPGCPSS